MNALYILAEPDGFVWCLHWEGPGVYKIYEEDDEWEGEIMIDPDGEVWLDEPKDIEEVLGKLELIVGPAYAWDMKEVAA